MPPTKAATNGASQSEEEVAQAVVPPKPVEPVVIKPIPIMLDPDKHPETGQDAFYKLRMTNKAMQLIEDQLGINLWEGLGSVGNFKPKHLAIMVWACLLWEHKDLKIEDVQEMPGMDIPNMLYVITRLDAVVYAHLPEADEKTGDEQSDPNASPSVGSNSGPSDASISG